MAVLFTGRKKFEIEFDTGEKETLYFNPNDPDFAMKLATLGERIQKKIEKFDDVIIGNDGEPLESKDFEKYEALKTALYSEIDNTFNYAVSEKIFKHCSAFALVDGEMFLARFVEYITPQISKMIKDEEKTMSKYIDKYQK